MNDQYGLTERDQKLLAKLECILSNDSSEEYDDIESLYGFCTHLASTFPQSTISFQQQLEERLVATLKQKQWQTAHSHQGSKRLRISLWSQQPLRWLLTGSMALMLLLGMIVAVPEARTVLAAWLGLSFEQRTALPPLAVKVLDHDGRSPLAEASDRSYEAYLIDLPQKRWAMIEEAGFSIPAPGSRIMLPNGGDFPVPGYLPAGYHWQDIVAMDGAVQGLGLPSLAHQRWAGGGPPMPPYNLRVDYLIGGNRTDRLLVLAQFQIKDRQGLVFRTFHAAETHFGLIIQPAEPSADLAGIVFLVGPGNIQKVSLGALIGWTYRGTWGAAGEWVPDAPWNNLVWEQEGCIYHLTGQEVPFEELVSIATSIPRKEVD